MLKIFASFLISSHPRPYSLATHHHSTYPLIYPRSLSPTLPLQDGYTLSDHGMVEIIFAVPPVSATPPEIIDPQVTPLYPPPSPLLSSPPLHPPIKYDPAQLALTHITHFHFPSFPSYCFVSSPLQKKSNSTKKLPPIHYQIIQLQLQLQQQLLLLLLQLQKLLLLHNYYNFNNNYYHTIHLAIIWIAN